MTPFASLVSATVFTVRVQAVAAAVTYGSNEPYKRSPDNYEELLQDMWEAQREAGRRTANEHILFRKRQPRAIPERVAPADLAARSLRTLPRRQAR